MGRWSVVSALVVFIAFIAAPLTSQRTALANPLARAARAYSAGNYRAALSAIPRRRAARGEKRLLRANALFQLKRYRRAAIAYRRALISSPHLADYIFFRLGEALSKRRRYRGAARAYANAIKVKGSSWVDRARRGLADALAKSGKLRAAERAYRKLLDGYQDHPGAAQITYRLALTLLKRNKIEGVELLRQVWVKHPTSVEANRAAAILRRLRKRRAFRAATTVSIEDQLTRVRRFRKVKLFSRALSELAALKRQHPKLADKLDLQLALTYRRADRPRAAVPVLEAIIARAEKRKSPVPWFVRRLYAEALAWTGKVQSGAAVLMDGVSPPNKKLRHAERKNVVAAAKLLADHARYDAALALTRRLATLVGERPLRQRVAWLSFRAGKWSDAIRLWRPRTKRAQKRIDTFTLYWLGRAYQEAGNTKAAEQSFRQLLEKHLRSYYGHLARSRLSELGRLKLLKRRCAPLKIKRPAVAVDRALLALDRKYGALMPRLRRARTLWRVGQRDAARRELRILAMDLTWSFYRTRRRAYRVRTWVERLWRGVKSNPKRWRLTATERSLRRMPPQKKRELLRALGPTLRDAGLAYWGWRFSAPVANRFKHYYPRAFHHQVARTAKRFGLDPNLIWAIMRTESSYRPDAISVVYAGGLMQLMPYTATRLAKELGLKRFRPEQVHRPRTNLLLAGHYLRALWSKFQGQIPLIAAAYNGGPHNVARWLDYRGGETKLDEFIEEIPFTQSRRYAKKIVRLLSIYERAYCNKDDLLLSNTLDRRYSKYPNY